MFHDVFTFYEIIDGLILHMTQKVQQFGSSFTLSNP